MTLKHSLIVFTLIITLFSCSSDSNDDNDTPADTSLLLKQRITNYDGDILTENFSYDGNKLTSILDSEGYKYEYLYEGARLSRINYEDPNGNIIDYTILTFNTDSRLASYIVYTEGDEAFRFELTYNTLEGTITEKEYIGDYQTQNSLISESIISYSNSQIITEMNDNDNFEAIYDYDTKNGIYKNISNIETLNLINTDFSGYIDSVENNLLKATENDNGNVEIVEAYQYTYNSSNYPDTASYFYFGELDSTIQYVYE